jgi:hypothetical protein
LKAWAERHDRSLTDELDRVVEEIRRKRFHERASDAYAQLREDEEAWDEHQKERDVWATTTADGLKEYPYEEDDAE